MIVIKPKDHSETKTLLVLVSRGPGRPQYENDTGGCSTLFLMGVGGGGRANVQLSMSRGHYNLMTSITVVVISFKERSQKLLVKECFFFFCLRIGTVYKYL